nr:MAG TPA: hypothetical protein [Caudoviricetes sp.]
MFVLFQYRYRLYLLHINFLFCPMEETKLFFPLHPISEANAIEGAQESLFFQFYLVSI